MITYDAAVNIVVSAATDDVLYRPPAGAGAVVATYGIHFSVAPNYMATALGRASYFATLNQLAKKLVKDKPGLYLHQIQYAWITEDPFLGYKFNLVINK